MPRKLNVAGSEKTEREIQFKTPLNLENFHSNLNPVFQVRQRIERIFLAVFSLPTTTVTFEARLWI